MHTYEDTIRWQIAGEVKNTMRPFTPGGQFFIGTMIVMVLWGLVAYIWQLKQGLIVTSMRDYVSWGTYMSNFVFFIGISHAGTLISAILRVTHAEWRRPITRMAEAITVFALMVGASMVIIDMGRPDRILNVIIHARLQSPILWDVLSITTYLTGSLLYLYVAMIPDLSLMHAMAVKEGMASWRIKLYRFMSLGFVPTPEKTRRLDIALATMAVIIIPVAVSVHTVVSWVFSMTLRPGWHSTIFGPYFVIGAIYSGTAAIIFAMAIFQKAYHLEKYLTKDHFKKLGMLLLALSIIYIYFTGCEYLTAWYGGASVDQRLLQLLMGSGPYWPIFLLMVVTGLFLPPLLIGLPGGWKFQLLILAAILVNIGMWLKRYLIVIPTMETPYIPAAAANEHLAYFPSWVELSITVAAFAMFALMYALFSKVFPILSITETAEPLEEAPAHDIAAFAPGDLPDRWPAISPPRVATNLAVLLALGTLVVVSPAARAQDEATPTPAPKIELTETNQEGEHLLSALVTLDGEPVEGASVTFTVSGRLAISCLERKTPLTTVWQ